MKLNFTKVLVFSLILGLVPLFTACNKENDTDLLKSRFETVSKEFKKPFEEGRTQIFGKVTGYSNPSIKTVLFEVFKADPELYAEKMPDYKAFDGSEYPKFMLDDGFLPVTKDFYIIINNDGNELYDVQVYFDSNGAAGPNRMGYDLFKYNLEAGDKLVPIEETVEAERSKDYFLTIE